MAKSDGRYAFKVGEAVRVKSGVTDPDFTDIPCGGWTGKIAETHAGKPNTYLVVLDSQTLQNIHPVYLKRCEREGLHADQMWMGEDELELDCGEQIPIDEPTNIMTKPLSNRSQDDRIRKTLGLTSDDPLPDVDAETLLAYYEHLAAKLVFPFQATSSLKTGMFQSTSRPVTVTALMDPDDYYDVEEGLFCLARQGNKRFNIPIADLEIAVNAPNRQLINDYAYWFANW